MKNDVLTHEISQIGAYLPIFKHLYVDCVYLKICMCLVQEEKNGSQFDFCINIKSDEILGLFFSAELFTPFIFSFFLSTLERKKDELCKKFS